MQAYENPLDKTLDEFITQLIVLSYYKKNCETFCHTATLLIHIKKYLSLVSHCFTKGKNRGRV